MGGQRGLNYALGRLLTWLPGDWMGTRAEVEARRQADAVSAVGSWAAV